MIPKDGKLKEKLSVLLPSLNEKQKRLLLGAEAIGLGYGGINYLAKITGMSPKTISRGVKEIEDGDTDGSAGLKLDKHHRFTGNKVLRWTPEFAGQLILI